MLFLRAPVFQVGLYSSTSVSHLCLNVFKLFEYKSIFKACGMFRVFLFLCCCSHLGDLVALTQFSVIFEKFNGAFFNSLENKSLWGNFLHIKVLNFTPYLSLHSSLNCNESHIIKILSPQHWLIRIRQKPHLTLLTMLLDLKVTISDTSFLHFTYCLSKFVMESNKI